MNKNNNAVEKTMYRRQWRMMRQVPNQTYRIDRNGNRWELVSLKGFAHCVVRPVKTLVEVFNKE